MLALRSTLTQLARAGLSAALLCFTASLAASQDSATARAARATLNSFPGELTPGVTPSPIPQVTVVTETGEPLTNTEVNIMTPTPGMAFSNSKASTDEQGTAVFPNLQLITSHLGAHGLLRIQVNRNARWETLDSQAFTTIAGSAERVEQVGTATAVARSGERLPVLTVKVTDAGNNPLEGATVSGIVSETEGTVEVSGGEATTKGDGIARFGELRLTGHRGSLSLHFVSGGKESTPIRLTLQSGRATTMVIVDQPPGVTITDSIFKRSLKIKVLDDGQNQLADQEVRVQLCDSSATDAVCNSPSDAELMGASLRATSDGGEVTFDSLGISGVKGKYYLHVQVPGCKQCTQRTTSITYDPDISLNRSYVAISAIKSIAGVIPDDEFFDIRFRFRISKSLFVMATTDVALTSRGSDTVRSTQRRLTEATLAFNRTIHVYDSRNSVPERVLYAGPLFKIFNTFPYAGIHFGSMELAGSPFQGSSLLVGPVMGLYSSPRIVSDRVIHPQLVNLFAEFFVRSETIDFFKSLNIRGSILLPVAHGEPLSSRIGIAVPVGTLHVF